MDLIDLILLLIDLEICTSAVQDDLKILPERLMPNLWMARTGDVISLPALTVWIKPGAINTAHMAVYHNGSYS